jgi:hypothetical protein
MIRLSYLGYACALSLCFAVNGCGDDEDDGGAGGTGGSAGGSGGSAGKGGSAGGTSSGGSAGAAKGGSAGATTGGSAGAAAGGTAGAASGGTAGATAGGAAGTAGAGGAGDPQSTACSAFPKTVTLGDTISLDDKGAVLCFNTTSKACRLTTNTYSDGTNPCPNADTAVYFLYNSKTKKGIARLQNTWVWNSASAGTISEDKTSLNQIDEDAQITAEAEHTGSKFNAAFSFDGENMFTIKSFAPKG